MADLSAIATSREYRQSDLEGQRVMLSTADPKGFGSLDLREQDQLLMRVESEMGRGEWEGDFEESFKRGAANASAHFAHIAANAADLSTPDAIMEGTGSPQANRAEEWFREKEEELIEAGTSPWSDKTNFEIGAESLGAVAVSVPMVGAMLYGGTQALTAMGLSATTAAGLAAIGTGFSTGALSKADQGWLESLKAGTADAAFFALFPALKGANVGRAGSASVLGTTAFMMTPEEMDIEERLGNGITMAILGAIFNAKASAEKQARKPGTRANPIKMEPEVEAKFRGEDAMAKTMQRRAYDKMEREQLADDRLELPKDPKEASEMDQKINELPPEERAMVEEIRAEEKAADARRADFDAQAGKDRIASLKIQRAKLPNDKFKKASEEIIDNEIKQIESKLEGDFSDPEIVSESEAGGERKDVSPLRIVPEGKGDPSGEGAQGRAAGEKTWRLGQGSEREPGFQGEEGTFRGEFEERFGKMGDLGPPELPPGERPPVPAVREAEVETPFIRESSKWDKRRLEYLDDGHGALWMMRELGMEDGPDSLYHKFSNLRGIPDAQDGMVRWGMPTLIPDPKIPGRMIQRFEPTTAYDVIEHPNGTYEAVPSPTRVNRGSGEIVAPIMGRGKKYEEDSWDYIQARQSNELITQHVKPDGSIREATQHEIDTAQTREKNWSLEKIEESLAKADPIRVAVYEGMKAAQRQMLQFYIDTGYITAEQAASFQRSEFAFSFNRQQEMGKQGRYRTEDKLARQYGIHKHLGSKRDLADRFTLWIQGMQDHYRAALQNQWSREVVETASAAGGFLERVPASAKRIVIGRETLKRALLDDTMELEDMTDAQAQARMRWVGQMPGDVERLGFFIGANRPYGSDIISYLRNGRPEYWRVHDQVLLRTFESLNREGRVGIAGRFMAGFKRFKQEMITTDPSFIAANFSRDPAMATVMTRTGSQALTSALRGLRHTTLKSDQYKDLIANGLGGASMRDGVRMTRKMLVKKAEQANRKFMNPRNLLFGPADVWRFLRETGRAIEMAPRTGESMRAREKGLFGPRRGEPATMHEAVFAGSEVSTDFRKRGGGQPTGVPGWMEKRSGGRLKFTAGPETIKFFADTVPFFNAMLAGSDRGYRSMARDPHGKAGTAFKTGMVGVMSMLLYTINRDLAKMYAHLKDEDGRPQVDFLNLPQWATTAAWHYYIPDKFDPETGEILHFTHYHMPKIWEIGMVGSWGERFAQYMMDGSEEDQDLFFDMIEITAHNFNINLSPKGVPFPLPAGIDIITEQGMNQILFTGQPIETRGMDEWQDWARSRSGTSKTMQALGQAARGQEWLWDPMTSPARAEALLRGVFGNWASIGLHITDEFLFPGGPALGWDDIPIIRRFYSEAGKYDKNTQIYYQNLEMFNQAFGTIREMNHRTNKAMVKEMKLDPDQRAMIQMAPAFDRANRRIQNYNREIDMLKRGVADKTATPKERHHSINVIEAKRNRTMKMLNIQANKKREKVRKKYEETVRRKMRNAQTAEAAR